MPATQILEYNVAQQAWEPRDHLESDGDTLGWHVASVRDGGSEEHALYQSSSGGIIFHADTGDDDEGVAIPFRVRSKRLDCGAVARGQYVFFRFEAVPADALTVTVTMGGAEYGEMSRAYALALAGSDDTEKRIRLHRTFMGRWIEVELSGSVANRPAIREMAAGVIPLRNGRLTV